MYRLLLLMVLFVSGCASFDADDETTLVDTAIEAAVDGAVQGAVAGAVQNAIAGDDEEETTPEEEEEKPFELADGVYQPDEKNPFKAPDFEYGAKADDPYYAPVIQQRSQFPTNANGGIYQVGMGDVFYAGQTANRIGDILTVNLNEVTSSTKSNDATISKSSSGALVNPTVLGREVKIDSTLPESGADFSGSAAANQSNSLNGTITVTVYDIYPNGVLAIRGEKWVTLNRGEEYIRLTGLVRRQDISPDNTVPSSRIADARITYSGTGEIATGSEQGWVSRFLNSGKVPD